MSPQMVKAQPAGVTGLRLASEIGPWSADGPSRADVNGAERTWVTASTATKIARTRSLALTMAPIVLDPRRDSRPPGCCWARGRLEGVVPLATTPRALRGVVARAA